VTLVATTPVGREQLAPLQGDDLELWVAEPGPNGRVDLAALLQELGRRGLLSTLAEAGGTLLAALLERGLIDEVAAFVAPKLVGGRSAPTPIGGHGVEDMAAAIELDDVSYERVGPDVLVKGVPRLCSAAS
jgi:diaminohydroxyphosphoribosylaminopyrimidine deaminase/5-amino-6-(5-phosphoribosylamino)uracil reductase